MLISNGNSITRTIYRFKKTGWGIYIDITGNIVSSVHNEDNNNTRITDGLWVHLPVRWPDVKYVYYALANISDEIISASPYKTDTLVNIHKITIANCDYQADGLVPAIYQWVSEALKIDTPEITVTYNKEQNKYEFSEQPKKQSRMLQEHYNVWTS